MQPTEKALLLAVEAPIYRFLGQGEQINCIVRASITKKFVRVGNIARAHKASDASHQPSPERARISTLVQICCRGGHRSVKGALVSRQIAVLLRLFGI